MKMNMKIKKKNKEPTKKKMDITIKTFKKGATKVRQTPAQATR